jgi:hypothetical protein
VELGEELLAREHLHLRPVGLHHVHAVPPALRLGDHALHDLVGKGPPQLHLDAVLLFEGIGERLGFGGRERRIQDDAALLLRALDEARVAIGAAIAEHLVVPRRVLAEGKRRGEREQQGKEMDRDMGSGAGSKLTVFRILCLNRSTRNFWNDVPYRGTSEPCPPRPRPPPPITTYKRSVAPSSSRSGGITGRA